MIAEQLGTFRVEVKRIGEISLDVVRANQVHGGIIVPVTQASGVDADGISATLGQPSFLIRTADCLPLIMCNAEQVVGLHVNRKSLLTSLLSDGFSFLTKGPPTFVFIGPHICAKHFSFTHQGPEVKQFCAAFPYACEIQEGITYLDMRAVVDTFLQEHITTPYTLVDKGGCTYEDRHLPSYRRWLDEGKKEPLDHIATVVSTQ